MDGPTFGQNTNQIGKLMTIQLNIGDHVSTYPGDVAIPNAHRGKFRWARTRAIAIARSFRTADAYFTSLPGGRTLTSLLADNSIWVNYNGIMPDFGQAANGGTDIAVGKLAVQIGRWTILATLIHELAHINGAPGRPSKAAERALVECGLGTRRELSSGVDNPSTPYDPGISG